MKLSKIFLILCATLLCLRCAKSDFPESFENEPVFKAIANVGDQTLHISAGVNDYYMFTSYERGVDNVWVFKGDLKQTTCPEVCAERLRIEIRDAQESDAEDTSDLSVLGQDLSFVTPLSPPRTVYRVSFQSKTMTLDSTFFTYLWDFGDGQISTEAHPIHDYDLDGTYVVSLTTIDENDCQSSQLQVIHLLAPEEACAVSINAELNQNTQIQLEATAVGDNNLFVWDIDSTFFNVIFPSTSGIYCVGLLDSSTCQSFSCAGVEIFNNPNIRGYYCTTSFTYDVNPVEVHSPVDSLQLAAITVIYTDAAGQEFRSDQGLQNGSRFNINQVEDFDNNENDEKTKLIDFQLNCLLYAENGTVLELTDGHFVLGIAHP